MKWYGKVILLLVAAALVCGVIGMVYLLRARTQSTEYQFQTDALLTAAQIANGGELTAEEGKAVIAEYGGRRAVIAPGNYQALSSYLRKDAMMPFLGRPDKERAIKITVLDLGVFYAAPADDTGDRLLVELDTQGKTFVMHARGGNLWDNLLRCCLEGTYHDQNLPLE